mgnify:CR=1 FL=1
MKGLEPVLRPTTADEHSPAEPADAPKFPSFAKSCGLAGIAEFQKKFKGVLEAP